MSRWTADRESLDRHDAAGRRPSPQENATIDDVEPLARCNELGPPCMMVAPARTGIVWMGISLARGGTPPPKAVRNSVYLLDPKTGKIAITCFPGGLYGLEAMPNGNAIIFSTRGTDPHRSRCQDRKEHGV